MEVEAQSDAVIAARLEWDSASAVDVDLQAIIVDVDGRIIDAAYYNNMKACGKAVTHSGDEVGDRGRSSEEVRVSLSQFPPKVHMVLFLACCFKGGDLRNAPGASVTFEHVKTKRRMSEVSLGASSSGMLVAALIRGHSNWVLRSLSEEVCAKHFMDCLDVLNGHIVAEIPTANRRQKVAFAMEKGEVFDFGESSQTVLLGLGWDVDQGEVDLDASAVLLDRDGAVLECVFFGNLSTSGEHSEPGAVVHSGDNLTGEGGGDDEAITVKVGALGEVVRDVFFCIHMYSKGRGGRPKTFSCVSNPYCRVVEGTEEVCRYTLSEAGDRSGLVIARLRRSPDGRWGFNALGVPSAGTMYKDAVPDMQRLARLDPRQLQRLNTKNLQSSPTTELEGVFGGAQPTAPSCPPSQSKQGDCCVS